MIAWKMLFSTLGFMLGGIFVMTLIKIILRENCVWDIVVMVMLILCIILVQ